MTQIQALTDALRRRSAYRRVFLAETQDAKLVLRDLMREAFPRHSMISPGKPDVTQANCGAHAFACGILKRIYSSDEDLHRQVKELYQQENA